MYIAGSTTRKVPAARGAAGDNDVVTNADANKRRTTLLRVT
jgi:hypothetical protein